jgi:hypothetical protein
MGQKEFFFLAGNPWEGPDRDVGVILKCMLKKEVGWHRKGSVWLQINMD